MLSPIDGEGARIVWIVKPRVQGGVIRMWALISEREVWSARRILTLPGAS